MTTEQLMFKTTIDRLNEALKKANYDKSNLVRLLRMKYTAEEWAKMPAILEKAVSDELKKQCEEVEQLRKTVKEQADKIEQLDNMIMEMKSND